MRKVIILIVLSIILAGCNPVMSDDIEFMKVVESLDTPEKIGQYMENNFEPKYNPTTDYSPYEMYLYQHGDCADYSYFSSFVSNYHGYKTYLVYMLLDMGEEKANHLITVIKINNKYAFFDLSHYECGYKSIADIMNNFSYISYEVEKYPDKRCKIWHM